MVNFSRRWNGDGCFSRTMEWRWSLQILTITINGSWQDQPLAAMVFQCLFSGFRHNVLPFLTSLLTSIVTRISFSCKKKRIIKGFLPVTIVNHWSPKLEKPLKNHRCQWLILPETINGDGENFQRPSPFHRWRKTTIAIPSP